uniref:MFS domain-containing protein n=1 Tax=Macrostomum lignano TaxID=282301 RepID=A0A1I8J5Z5_9PLAT
MTAADAMEMLLLSVLGPALRCDWRLTSAQVAGITTVVFAGMLLGAPVWGAVSDKRGRWSVSAICFILMAYFGLLCSFAPNYFWLASLRGIVGFNIGGAATSFTLLSEYLPQRHRAKVLILFNLFWGVGSTFEILLAYLVLPTLGWRYLVAFSSLPLILTLPSLWCLPESARFLLASGKADEAVKVIDQIARENGRPLMKGRPAGISETETRGHIWSLFHTSYRRTTLILFCLWFGIAFSYYGIVLVSSEMSQLRRQCDRGPALLPGSESVASNASLVKDNSCCRGLEAEDYKAMFISSFGEFLIIPFNLLTIDWLGRRWTLAINYLLMGVFFGLICLCVPSGVSAAFLLLARAHAGGIFKIDYIYTTEVYPTVIRSIGLGICSAMARFGSMSAPFVAQVVLPDVSLFAGFATFALVGIGCAGLSLMLPIETRGRAMPQSLDVDEIDQGGQQQQVLSYRPDPDGSSATLEIKIQGKIK